MTHADEPIRIDMMCDVCALPLVNRLAAMLDRDTDMLRDGEPLPRGWHVMLFNAPTAQSQLRDDGTVHLGVELPDIGLPRLMLGGRQTRYDGMIPIGARVRRESRQGAVQLKQGRSGRFALIKVEHRIFVEDAIDHVVVEVNDYVLREASGAPASSSVAPARSPLAALVDPRADNQRTLVPDERLLFRYSAITDNPHRIHYDLAYAMGTEGYPALVVNGSIPAMFLLEMFRAETGREPASLNTRNVAPMFAGRPLTLCIRREPDDWRLWAQDAQGTTTFEARAS